MPIYMNLGGIEGDSRAERFRNWFEVFSFNWGETNASSVGGGGGGAGRVQFSDLTVMKRSGKGSPLIMLACASGRHLPAVQLVVTNTHGEQEVELQRYNLTSCMVTSFQTSGDGDSTPTESLSLNFTKIEFRQTYFDDEGRPTVQVGIWDIQGNRGG